MRLRRCDFLLGIGFIQLGKQEAASATLTWSTREASGFHQHYETKSYALELCPKAVTLSSRNQLLSNFETKTAGSVWSRRPELTIYWGLPRCKNL